MEIKDENMNNEDESMDNEEEKPKKYRGEQFFYLLSEDEVKQFGEDDYITEKTKSHYYFDQVNQDPVDELKVVLDQIFEWRRRCQHCEIGSVLIKAFEGAKTYSDSDHLTSNAYYTTQKRDKDKLLNSNDNESFKKLLSEEDAKLFQAKDFIGHIVTYVYDATGELKGMRKGSYNWNRPCPHCENGYKTIKTFEGESANMLIEIEKVAHLENSSEPDKPDNIEG